MTTITTQLSVADKALVTDVIAAEAKLEEWEATADERWTALMTVVLADDKVGQQLRELFVAKRIAKAVKVKGEALTDDEKADTVKSARNVWKTRKSNVKNGGRKSVDGNRMVTVKGEAERAADFRSAARLALGAGVTVDVLRAIIDEEEAKLKA